VGFTSAQAARLARCTPSQVAHWRRTGLVRPSGPDGRYLFRDLVALRVVTSLLESGLSLGRIRVALDDLRAFGGDLTSMRLVTDGVTVWVCHDDGQILDALAHGQLALFVAVDRLAGEVEAEVRTFHDEREAFVAQLASEAGDDARRAAPGRSPG
jgi:DNA-binding transcriptional MerR regulator